MVAVYNMFDFCLDWSMFQSNFIVLQIYKFVCKETRLSVICVCLPGMLVFTFNTNIMQLSDRHHKTYSQTDMN